MFFRLLVLSFCILLNSSAQAQSEEVSSPKKESKTKPPVPDYPKQGVLSVNGSVGHANLSIKEPWVGPIQGSISKADERTWKVGFSNTDAEHTFQINGSVEQFTMSGSSLKMAKRNPFSVRLAPGKSNDRTIRAVNNSVGARIVLTNWKLLK